MRDLTIYWDPEDDPEGNAWHVADHGLTPAEVDSVLRDPESEDESRSSGRPAVFGYTDTGRFIMVIYEDCGDDSVYPITAFEVPEP